MLRHAIVQELVKTRERMHAELGAAITRLKDDLMARCGLGEEDLPRSPQERMREP